MLSELTLNERLKKDFNVDLESASKEQIHDSLASLVEEEVVNKSNKTLANNKDKRIILIYIIVIIALLAGVTYALQSSSLAFNLTTALIGLDEEKRESRRGR